MDIPTWSICVGNEHAVVVFDGNLNKTQFIPCTMISFAGLERLVYNAIEAILKSA